MEARIRTKEPNLIVSGWFEKSEQDLDRITRITFYNPNKQGGDIRTYHI
jgi:hypothetical protein